MDTAGKILVLENNTFTGANLTPGRYYQCEPAAEGTDAQNKTFHTLLNLYFLSGLYSYPAKNEADLKKQIKLHLGMGFERYVYVKQTGKGFSWGDCKTMNEVPENVAVDENGKKMVRGVLKSWKDYSKAQRTSTIQNLITEMIAAGVNTVSGNIGKKFNEILQGLENNAMAS